MFEADSSLNSLEVSFSSEAKTYLHYDTHCTLSFSFNDMHYVLQSTGFYQNTLKVVQKDKFDGDTSECLFRILPQANFKYRSKMDGLIQILKQKRVDDPNFYKFPKIFEIMESDNRSRFEELQRLRGKFITFFTPVQLQHLASHKFLSLKTKQGDLSINEGPVFTLEESPSEDSVLKLLPSFKFQTENQKYVRFDQEIYISNHGKPESHFMHLITNGQKQLVADPIKYSSVFVGDTKLKTKFE